MWFFIIKNKEFCQKVRVFADDVIFYTMCKGFLIMDIIDKITLVKGYKNCKGMTGYKNFVQDAIC